MSDQIRSVARLIGNSYAHVQHGIDRAIEWGFETMQKQAEVREKAPPKNTAAGKVATVGKGVLGFLGAAGEAYFRTYSDLKKKAK